MAYPTVDTAPKQSIKSGQTTVSTAGTAVQVASGEIYEVLIIKALAGNTGNVYIGNDGSDDVTSSNGLELQAGEGVTLYINGNADVYVDAANNGDKVSWIALVAAGDAY